MLVLFLSQDPARDKVEAARMTIPMFLPMCHKDEHIFTHTQDEIPPGTICDCRKLYWDGEQAQPIDAPEPCLDCYSLPKAAGADWCMDCPWLVAWWAKEEAKT